MSTNQYILLLSMLALTACGIARSTTTPDHPVYHGSTDTDANGKLMLLGEHPVADLQLPPFGDWYNKNYADYQPDSAAIAALKPLLQPKRFELYMGTWCPDSRREAPRMLKVLEACGVPPAQIRLVLLDYRTPMYKQSPTHEEAGKGIHHVPSLVVYDENGEEGRIVESPVTSVEKDLQQIALGRYTPHYPAAAFLLHAFNGHSLPALQARFPALADSLQHYATNAYELNTLGRVLYEGHEAGRALLTWQLNARLFPKDAQVYANLGSVYLAMADKEGAREHFGQALELDPTNAAAKSGLIAAGK